MAQPLAIVTEEKRLNSKFYVEGFATTFDTPYLLFEDEDGIKYYEVIDRNALNSADLTDVVFQHNHQGTVFARNKMAQGKPTTLVIEPQARGLFVAADLSVIEEARREYESIENGLIYKMSWGFRANRDKDRYERGNMSITRVITEMRKVFDVSAVSHATNDDTEISVRSCFDGVIEAERREALARHRKILMLKIKMEV